MKINKIIIVATLALGLPSCFSQEKKTEESAKVSAKKECSEWQTLYLKLYIRKVFLSGTAFQAHSCRI